MSKKIVAICTTILILSGLLAVSGCTEQKSNAEHFAEAAQSVVQYFKDYLAEENPLPDASEKNGVKANGSIKIDQLEANGESLIDGAYSGTIEFQADRRTKASEGNIALVIDGEPIELKFIDHAADIYLGFPEASDQYLALFDQKDHENPDLATLLNAVRTAITAQITNENVEKSTVEYQVNGVTENDVIRWTLTLGEQQIQAVLDSVVKTLRKSGCQVDDDPLGTGFSKATVELYTFNRETVAAKLKLTQPDEGGQLEASLDTMRPDDHTYSFDGSIGYTGEDVDIQATLSGKQTITADGRTEAATFTVSGGGQEFSLQLQGSESKSGQNVKGEGVITPSIKTGGATVSIEIPYQVEYTVDGDRVIGEASCRTEFQGLVVALSGTFDYQASDDVSVTTAQVPEERRITQDNIDQETEAFREFIGELQKKYPKLMEMLPYTPDADKVDDPEHRNIAFILSHSPTGLEYYFYTDRSGTRYSYCSFEPRNGTMVIMPGEPTEQTFSYIPLEAENYKMQQQVAIDGIPYDALVMKDVITLSNDALERTYYFDLADTRLGSISMAFDYEMVDGAAVATVRGEDTQTVFTRSADGVTYESDGMIFDYTDGKLLAD